VTNIEQSFAATKRRELTFKTEIWLETQFIVCRGLTQGKSANDETKATWMNISHFSPELKERLQNLYILKQKVEAKLMFKIWWLRNEEYK